MNGTKLISVPHIIDKIFSSGDNFWSAFVTFMQQDVGYSNGFLRIISLKSSDFSPFVITFNSRPFDQFTTNILTFAYVHAFQTKINGAKRRRKTEL